MKNPLTAYAKTLLKEKSGFVVERSKDGSRYYIGCAYYAIAVPQGLYGAFRLESGLFPDLEPGTQARTCKKGEFPSITSIGDAGPYAPLMDKIPDTYTPATDWRLTLALERQDVAILTTEAGPVFVDTHYWQAVTAVCPDRYRGKGDKDPLFIGNPEVDAVWGIVCPVKCNSGKDALSGLMRALEAAAE